MVMTEDLYKNKDNTLMNLKVVTRKGRAVSEFISDSNFPVQNNDLIGTKIHIKYRKMTPYIHLGDNVIYETNHCIILRCDKTDPYIFIGWIENTINIVVGNTNKQTGEPLPNVLFVDEPQNEFLLLQAEDYYDSDFYDNYNGSMVRVAPTSGIIIKADQTSSDIVVIAEELGDNVVRFVLGEEVATVLKNYKPSKPKVTVTTFVEEMNRLLNLNTIYKSPYEI